MSMVFPIGELIEVISNSDIRYEGILHSVDMKKSNLSVTRVRAFGTEGRRNGQDEIPESDSVYEYIVFNILDIKDLRPVGHQTTTKAEEFNDPAIVSARHESDTHDYHSDLAGPRGSSMGNHNIDDGRYFHHNRGHVNQGRGGRGRGFYDNIHHRDRRGGGYREGGNDYGNQHHRHHHDNGSRGGGGGAGYHRQNRQDGRTGKEFLVDESSLKNEKEQFTGDFDFTRGKEEFEKKKKEFEEAKEKKGFKAYDKSESFFDHISCDQNKNRIGREVMKKTDTETFGPDLVGNMRSYRRRGRFRR